MSTPILLATSPAACPPMPSQTTNMPSWVSYPKLSSLLVRTQPTSLLPDTSMLKLIRRRCFPNAVPDLEASPWGKPHISGGFERFCGFYWAYARIGKGESAEDRYQLQAHPCGKPSLRSIAASETKRYNRAPSANRFGGRATARTKAVNL